MKERERNQKAFRLLLIASGKEKVPKSYFEKKRENSVEILEERFCLYVQKMIRSVPFTECYTKGSKTSNF
jgi:hypothetical protein